MKFSLETNKWPANSDFLARRRSELMDGMSGENQRRQRILHLVAVCTQGQSRLVSHQRKWFIERCWKPGSGDSSETRNGGLGFVGSDCEFRRNNQLLPAYRFRCGFGGWCCKCLFHNASPLAVGGLDRPDRARILATASCKTMRGPGKNAWQCSAMGCRCGGFEHDPASSRNRGVDCRPARWGMETVKRRAIFVAAAAAVVLLAIAYLWGPSSVPAGQEPLVTLSDANWGEFATAFDADPNVPRMVLLLSPT